MHNQTCTHSERERESERERKRERKRERDMYESLHINYKTMRQHLLRLASQSSVQHRTKPQLTECSSSTSRARPYTWKPNKLLHAPDAPVWTLCNRPFICQSHTPRYARNVTSFFSCMQEKDLVCILRAVWPNNREWWW